MKYFLFCNAVHMPKEERLMTRYRINVVYRSYPLDQGFKRSQHPRQEVEILQKASEWEQNYVVVSYGKFGSLGGVAPSLRTLCRAML